MTKFMKSDLKPDYVLEKLNEINKTSIISKNNNGNKLFKLLTNINLSPKQVIIKHKLNMECFNYIIESIKLKFKKSIAHPSEMVGVVAAQSIGEPCTISIKYISCIRYIISITNS